MNLRGRFTPAGRLRAARDRAARRATGPLAQALATPLPGRDDDVRDVPLLAVDMETTGLDPARDRLLSIGFVPVDGLAIALAGADGCVVRGSEVGQSATVHRLTDDVIAGGVDLTEAITLLLRALAGRVLLAHYATIEQHFLDAACRSLFGAPAPWPAVDTLELQRRVHGAGGEQILPAGTLRLAAARDSFGLPRYRAHEAGTDALACAELYLAQVARLSGGAPMPLRRVLA